MKIDDLIYGYINRSPSKPRKIGEYWASEVYYIVSGKMTPESFFKRTPIDRMGSKYCSEGISIEDYLTKVFKEMKVEVKCQDYKQIEITDNIKLTVKPDYNFGTFLAELKRPARVQETISTQWLYQLECYYRGFYLPVYLWQVSYPITIKQLDFTPSKARWDKIKSSLIEFDLKLKDYERTNSSKNQ